MLPRLSILGRDVIVEKVADMPKEFGEADSDTNTIRIREGQQLLMEADTLLHESLHLIDTYMQLNLSERQIYCIAVAIIALIRDNVDVLPYLEMAVREPRKV